MPGQNSINTLNSVNPSVCRLIREAFDDAVKAVQERRGLSASDDTRAKLARQIVEMARHGERDSIRLRDGALTALHIDS